MSAVELVALASTVSLLAGWRLYFVTFAIGLGMKFGWIDVPEQLRALDVLANNWIVGIAALGALAEFFADKIAWVDSAWDAVHAVVRPVGGGLLAMAIIDGSDLHGRSEACCSVGAQRCSRMPARLEPGPSSTQARSRFPTSPCQPARMWRPAAFWRWRSALRSLQRPSR